MSPAIVHYVPIVTTLANVLMAIGAILPGIGGTATRRDTPKACSSPSSPRCA